MKLHLPSLLRKALMACVAVGVSFSGASYADGAFLLTTKITAHDFNGYGTGYIVDIGNADKPYYLITQAGAYVGLSASNTSMSDGTNEIGANSSGTYSATQKLHTITGENGELVYGWVSLNNNKGSAAYGIQNMYVTIDSNGIDESSITLDFDGANENDTLIQLNGTVLLIDDIHLKGNTNAANTGCVFETTLTQGTWHISQDFSSAYNNKKSTFTVAEGGKIVVADGITSTITNLTNNGAVEVQTGGTLTITGATINKSLVNNGTLTVGGEITVGAEKTEGSYYKESPDAEMKKDGNGYAAYFDGYIIGTGNGTYTQAEGTVWKDANGNTITSVLNEYGVLGTGGSFGTEYYVNTGTVNYDGSDKFAAATMLFINGGELQLTTNLPDSGLKIAGGTIPGTLNIGTQTVNQAQHVNYFQSTVTLKGSGVYDLGGENALEQHLKLDATDWTGTIKLSGDTTGLALFGLGNANSTIDVEGTHSLADGAMSNYVSSDITGGGTLQLGDSGFLTFNKNGGTVSAKITGSGDVSVSQNTSFSNNVTANAFSVIDVSATTSAIVYATTVSGHIIGADAQSAQSVTTDRVAEHGTLVERTAKDGVTINNPTTLENVALGSQIKITDSADSKLTLKGNIEIDGSFLDSSYFTDSSEYYDYYDEANDQWHLNDGDSGNGFKAKAVKYHILTGQNDDNLVLNDVTWTVDGKAANFTPDKGEGYVTVEEKIDTSTYWVQSKDGKAVYMRGDAENIGIATFVNPGSVVMLKGGTLVFDLTTRSVSDMDMFGYSFGTNVSEMGENDSPISTIRLTKGAVLKSSDFYSVLDGAYSVADGSTLVLEGEKLSYYVVNSGLSLGKGIKLGEDWKGIVYSDALVAQGEGDLTALTNGSNSTVQVGGIDTDVLTVDGHLFVADGVVLSNGASRVGGDMTLGKDLGITEDAMPLSVSAMGDADEAPVASPLALGSQGAAATLTIDGVLTTPGGILYNHEQSMVTAADIGGSTLDILIKDPAVMDAFGTRARDERVVLVSLTDAAAATPEALLNGSSEPIEKAGEKYSSSVAWEGRDLVFTAIPNAEYLSERFERTLGSANARSGAALLGSVFAATNPQKTAPDGDLAKLLNAADSGSLGEEGFAAAAGSSTTALGMAFSGDVERQLRAIRNRTTSMGVNPCVVNEGMPYFNAWINAEGNMAELDQDGTMPGYTLDSWGGTVGFDADVNPNLTIGMAVTAMYGDLKTDGPDMLDGDMDTYYVSAFARYTKRAWSHTFVATVGKMDTTYERTVSHAGDSYTTEGDTDGTAFGLMYEAARTFTLDRDGDVAGQLVANVTYRHTTVSGYEETGSDAALKADDQTLDTITFGVGGRMQAVVGENTFNRSAVFEARALAKLDAGDRSSEADVAFLRGGRSATVESAELGAFGVELGAGLSIPVGDENDGTIFLDVSAELRSGYSNVNGTLGYRINF